MPKRCKNKRHGVAKPKVVAPFTACSKCLKEDWRNYYVTLEQGGSLSWQQ